MNGRVIFGDAQRDDITLARQLVLRRLREDKAWKVINHPEQFDGFLEFTTPQDKAHFLELADTVMWELVVLGVILPGSGGGRAVENFNLPNFRRTEYGEKVLQAGRFIPHDPAGYVGEACAVGQTCVGAVARGYLEEALRCFNRICYTASVLLLGVAAEATFLQLGNAISPFIGDPNERKRFEKLVWVKDKHRWIVAKYEQLERNVKRVRLPDGMDISLKGIYDLIGRQRNELGHPQNVPPEVDKDHAFASFRLFLTYLRDMEAFVEYCRTAGI